MTGVVKSPSLPDHPILAAWASALNDTGNFAEILDTNWRYVFVTDELSVTRQALGLPAIPIGAHLLSAEGVQAELGGSWPSPEVRRAWFLTAGRYVLASTPGGREELRRLVHPEFADLVDELQSLDHPAVAVLAPLRERAAAFGVAAGSTASGANAKNCAVDNRRESTEEASKSAMRIAAGWRSGRSTTRIRSRCTKSAVAVAMARCDIPAAGFSIEQKPTTSP